MPNAPVPYMLRPKATRLPAGHDPSLDAEPGTDAERRTVPPSSWLFADVTPGDSRPQDAPLAPPATDPAIRSLAPFDWPTSMVAVPNRALRELVGAENITLDPDLDLWPACLIRITPFGGAPTTGIWPAGWMLMDNAGVLRVCIVGGSPGTWQAVGVSSGVSSFNTRTGAVVPATGDYAVGQVTGAAPLASPTFTGTPSLPTGATAVTQAPLTDNTTVSTTAYTDAAVAAGVAVALPHFAGHLASPYSATTSFATFLTTASLAVGTWLVNFSAAAQVSNTHTGDIKVVAGTATATFDGGTSNTMNLNTGSPAGGLSLSFIATVTVAGTLAFQAVADSNATLVIQSASLETSTPNATGYTAVKIG